nr:M20/M25/M40 family metallo-hydrolase [Polymorphobacter sp.]
MIKWLALAATLVTATVLAFITAQPPAPLPANVAATQFSAARAMPDIRAIASVPHTTASPENAAAAAHLVARLESLGFQVRTATSPLPETGRKRLRKWGSPQAETAQLTNIIALRPGRDPAQPAVALMAHYDSVWASPGAADDAAGVAAALEIARAIPRESQARDLVILLTDAEELGLWGAKAFFAPGSKGDPLASRIGALINLETRGGGGRAFMFETGPRAGAMIELYRQSVTQPSTTSMAVKLYQLLPNSTDYTPALKRGIPGFNLAFTGKAGLYHSPLATPDNLDQGALQHLGSQGLDLARALVTAPGLPPAAPDVVFGDVLGAFTFAYAPVIGWLLLGAVAGLMTVAARTRRADWRWRGVAGGVLDGLLFTAVAAVLLYLGNLLSGADGDTNYYDRLAALPRLETQALLLFTAGLAIALALLPHRRSLWDGWLGLAIFNTLIAIAVQVFLPAAGAIFTLPLLLAAIAMLVAARAPRTTTPLAMLVAVPALAWLGGLTHVILLGIGAGMPSAAAAFAPLAFLLHWPLLPHVPRRPALLAALILILAAGSIALWVRLDPIAASIPPYPPRG